MNRRELFLSAVAAVVAPAIPVRPFATGGFVKPGHYIVGERGGETLIPFDRIALNKGGVFSHDDATPKDRRA